VALNQNIRQGVAWLFLGNTGNQVLAFLFGIVLARLLAPEDFGMLVAIQIYTGIAGFVAGGGMGQALVQARDVAKQDYDVVFTVQAAIGCLLYGVFYFTAPYLANWYETPLYADLIRVSALSFLLRPLVNLPSNYLHRERRFKVLASVNVTVLIISSAVSVALAWLGYGVWSLIVGGLIGSSINACVLMIKTGWLPRFSCEWRRAGSLARYGTLVAIGDFIVYLRSQSANFVLSRTLGAQAIGLHNKAASFSMVPHGTITGAVYQVTFRTLAKDRDNVDLSQYLYLRSITLVSLYTWPVFLALAWLALPVMRLLYGDKWVGAAIPLAWLAIVGPFVMLEMLAGAVLAARGWLHREVPLQVAQLVMVLMGSVGGLPYGLLGVAIGASVANVYGALHMSWLAARCLSMSLWRIPRAMCAPLLFNAAVACFWFSIDQVFAPHDRLGDLTYIVLMLGSGSAIFGILFFALPVPSLASERLRWLSAIKMIFFRSGKNSSRALT
jgi:O-antigen/teichoic acid export membrane protein